MISAMMLSIVVATASADRNIVSKTSLGGVQVPTQMHEKEYPWMVAILVAGGNVPKCAGVHVGGGFVLTAAHCLDSVTPSPEVQCDSLTKPPASSIKVIFSAWGDAGLSSGTTAAADAAWNHPDCVGRFFTDAGGNRRAIRDRDLGLIHVKDLEGKASLSIGKNMKTDLIGQSAKILGWGKWEQGETSQYLRSADQLIIDDKRCGDTYRGADMTYRLCGYYQTHPTTHCPGDSGGPLLVGNRLAGIATFGGSCVVRNSTDLGPCVYELIDDNVVAWVEQTKRTRLPP